MLIHPEDESTCVGREQEERVRKESIEGLPFTLCIVVQMSEREGKDALR